MAAKKGVVVEKGKDWAVILLPGGEFKRVRTQRYLEVGDLYEETIRQPFKYVAAAAILLAILCGTIDYYSVKSYAQVYSGVELGVNRWGRVISIKSTNSQGQRILKTIDIRNDKLEAAIEKIKSQVQKDQQENNKILQNPDWAHDSSAITIPAPEEGILNQLHKDLIEDVPTPEHKDEIKEDIKNKIKQQISQPPKIIIPRDEKPVIPTPNPDQTIDQEKLKTDINNLNHRADSLESTIKNQYDEASQDIHQDIQQKTQELQSDLKEKIDSKVINR